jgi:membrane-associated protease RseP (regulator of RpoE activity)
MSYSRLAYTTAAIVAVRAVLPCFTNAQEGETFVRITPTQDRCPTDAYVVGYIGYKDLECNCSFTIGPDGPRYYEFRAEPVIGAVEPGSPADGKLRAGDVITAIDGHLITTREGGRRFARPAPSEPVGFTVRRQGRELDVTLVPDHACYEVASLPPPRAPRPALGISNSPPLPRPTSDTPAPPPADLSNGWVGLSIKCKECSVGDSAGVPVWNFSFAPEVDRVEAHSPADRAGIRSGDVLTHVNGLLFTSREGGRLFGAIQPGDKVTFRYTRNNAALEAEMIAGTRIRYSSHVQRGWSYYRADTVVHPPNPITRFSGLVGDTHVLVTGGPVSVNRTEDEVVIQAGDVTVRIRRTGGTP